MQNCANCTTAFDAQHEGLVVTQKNAPVTAVCETCLTNARLIKIVLRRGAQGAFAYEQWSTLETSNTLSAPRRGA